MKTITKLFKRLQDAERFQSLLQSQYDHVRLIGFPRFSQEGRYTWEVS